jgi:hypothetical protein
LPVGQIGQRAKRPPCPDDRFYLNIGFALSLHQPLLARSFKLRQRVARRLWLA